MTAVKMALFLQDNTWKEENEEDEHYLEQERPRWIREVGQSRLHMERVGKRGQVYNIKVG